ncbi:hypothetical protein [Desulfuribacillus alkaliarsenatis]|uniref:DUF4367 domain-containing protein n=1 Tax=Desulfuribacillus alkaliarsenatis TaxID=766136 RepID=A0A1E5G110_9FIRM|nr:hypothetical protein [Desulfuribacillus alkaliarsenatis]OEF96551.1 hypothetical protein BHF68_07845 [Desulfuribacillus alkaliarsenatis]
MNKKYVISTLVAFVMALVMFVQPVQTLALDFLSIFRVNDVKTIRITLADIEEGMQTMSNMKEGLKGQELDHKQLVNIVSQQKPEKTTLNDARDFGAFRFQLPRELDSEQPTLFAVESASKTFTIDVDASNEFLTMINSQKLLSNQIRDVEFTQVSSATAFAKYDEVLFLATQKSFLNAPDAVKDELHDVMINLPIIPTNIRQQLAEIEQDSADIYLPVLVGFGREVDLGGKKGYIYTVSDFKALTETMSGAMPEIMPHNKSEAMPDMKEKFIVQHGEQQFDNASVLVWTENGLLYSLIADKADAELAKIARSVR